MAFLNAILHWLEQEIGLEADTFELDLELGDLS